MLLAAASTVSHRTLQPLDIGIIAVYFVIVFSIGFYFSLKERTSEDYFLASRHVGWFAIGASLFVSNISTEHFIGLAGSGATSGLAVGHFEWLACLILLVLGWVFVPFYLRSNVFTMPEFLERRFNRHCSVYLATHLDPGLHLHQDLRPPLRGRDRPRARGGLEPHDRGHPPGGGHRGLHRGGGPGRGDLHRPRADADPPGGGHRPHRHRPRQGRRLRRACGPRCPPTTSA